MSHHSSYLTTCYVPPWHWAYKQDIIYSYFYQFWETESWCTEGLMSSGDVFSGMFGNAVEHYFANRLGPSPSNVLCILCQ
jgi:hypothetical protein